MISNKHNLKERIGRLRAKSNGDGLVVRNYQDLDNIPTNFKAFKDETFLVLEEVLSSKKVWGFMAKSGKQLLEVSELWAVDGTHKTSTDWLYKAPLDFFLLSKNSEQINNCINKISLLHVVIRQEN